MMNALCFGVSAAAAGSSDLSKFFKSKIWPFLIDEDNISQTTKMTCPVTLSPTATETVSLTIMGGSDRGSARLRRRRRCGNCRRFKTSQANLASQPSLALCFCPGGTNCTRSVIVAQLGPSSPIASLLSSLPLQLKQMNTKKKKQAKMKQATASIASIGSVCYYNLNRIVYTP